MQILIGSASGNFLNGAHNIQWTSTFPIGLTGTGSLGNAAGVQRLNTGSFQINARNPYPSYLNVTFGTLAVSGSESSMTLGAGGLEVHERYDLRSSNSGSNGGQGTIVFEITNTVPGVSGSALIDPTVPVLVACTVWAKTTSTPTFLNPPFSTTLSSDPSVPK